MKTFCMLTGLLFFGSEGLLLGQTLMHYTSEEYGYSIQVPEDWNRKDDVRSEQISMVLVGPEASSMSVVFHNLPSGMKPDEFVSKYHEFANQNKPNATLEEKGVFKSRDDEANYIIFEYDTDILRMRSKACIYFRKDDACVVTLTYPKSGFHTRLPEFDTILKSFTFETDQEKVDELPQK